MVCYRFSKYSKTVFTSCSMCYVTESNTKQPKCAIKKNVPHNRSEPPLLLHYCEFHLNVTFFRAASPPMKNRKTQQIWHFVIFLHAKRSFCLLFSIFFEFRLEHFWRSHFSNCISENEKTVWIGKKTRKNPQHGVNMFIFLILKNSSPCNNRSRQTVAQQYEYQIDSLFFKVQFMSGRISGIQRKWSLQSQHAIAWQCFRFWVHLPTISKLNLDQGTHSFLMWKYLNKD